jgi:hypothetical protein
LAITGFLHAAKLLDMFRVGKRGDENMGSFQFSTDKYNFAVIKILKP